MRRTLHVASTFHYFTDQFQGVTSMVPGVVDRAYGSKTWIFVHVWRLGAGSFSDEKLE